MPPGGGRPSVSWADARREASVASDRNIGYEDGELLLDSQPRVWYAVMSTWINRVYFDWRSSAGGPPTIPTKDFRNRMGFLRVEFLDLAVIEYTAPMPYSVFDDMINSSSKGRFTHDQLVGLPYRTISRARRKVTAALKRARDANSALTRQRTFRRNGRIVRRNGHNVV